MEPLLREWIERYKALAPGVTIDYEATGSAVAVDRFKAGEPGDFFSSDIPLTPVEEATLGGSAELTEVPWATSAIAVAYNVPDVPALRLSPDTVAGIFAGRILRWDDAAIKADNEGVHLPNLGIQVVYRSDGSGTTWTFTSYLSAAAPGAWDLGTGAGVRFPRGTGARGSEAVAAAVKRTSGAVTYVQLGFATRAGLGVALLGNRAGKFVAPAPEAVNAALAAANTPPHGTTPALLFTPDSPGSYPLAMVHHLVFRRSGRDPAKAAALRHFTTWALSEGQRFAEPLGYTPVPRQFQVPALVALQQE